MIARGSRTRPDPPEGLPTGGRGGTATTASTGSGSSARRLDWVSLGAVVLLLVAAEVSAGALSSAFAGAVGASAAVSLPVAAVSVSVVAVLESAGLVLLPAFSVLLSVAGALSGWRAGDGAASGDTARGAGFRSSGVGDALGTASGAAASAGDEGCGLPFMAGPSWAGRGRASAGVRSAAACWLPEPSAKDLPLPKGRVSGSWAGSSPSGVAGASSCDGVREDAAGRGGDTGPRAAAKPARRCVAYSGSSAACSTPTAMARAPAPAAASLRAGGSE